MMTVDVDEDEMNQSIYHIHRYTRIGRTAIWNERDRRSVSSICQTIAVMEYSWPISLKR